MRARRRIVIGVVLAIAVVAGVASVVLTRARSRDRAFLADAAPAVQLARDFMTDALSGRLDAAAPKTADFRHYGVRAIEQELAHAGASGPILSQEYMVIYRRHPDSGHTVWRVDAKLTLAGGRVMYAQFSISRAPATNVLTIDIWHIEPWPKSGFTLGDADPGFYTDAEWAPGTREVRPRR